MKTGKWIADTLGRQKWRVAILCVIQSVFAASGTAFALLMRRVIDDAVAGKKTAFRNSVMLLIILILTQILLQWLRRFLEDDIRAATENRLRQRALRDILNTEYGKIKEYHTGELMNRITSDTAIVTDGAVSLAPEFLAMAVRILAAIIVMGTIDKRIALVFLTGGCLITACSVAPRKMQKKMHRQVQEADGKVRSFLQEALESLLIIHGFDAAGKIESLSGGMMKTHRLIRRKRSRVFNLYGTGLRLIVQGGYMLGFVWCGLGILKGSITYGTLTAVMQLIGQIQTPFSNIGGTFPRYTSMLASAERLMELSLKADEKNAGGLTAGGLTSGGITTRGLTRDDIYGKLTAIHFEDVSFSYSDDRPVLSGTTFEVNKGEFVAITGHSGVGKSTIMKLLLSVYTPDKGRIYMRLKEKAPLGVKAAPDDNLPENGIPPYERPEDGILMLSDIPRGMFAYVPQGNFLMSGTIRQVVGFAEKSDKIDDDKVRASCVAACADKFIMELPSGYDTVLGERGDGLSEGQMQRIAVARAVYSGCPVLLLDESTSALDARTEQRMISSLKRLPDITVFLVTHRKEAIKLCDRVIKL